MKNIANVFVGFMLLAFLNGEQLSAQIHLALKGGLDISSIKFSENIIQANNVTGFHIGPMLEVMTPIGIGFDGAILYSQKGMSVEKELENVITNYLEIPLNLKLKMGIPLVKAYIIAGPYAEIRLSGEEDVFKTMISQVETKTFAAGVNLGIGAELLSRIQLGLHYGIGLTDNYSVDKINGPSDVSVKRKTISISAALLF